MFELLTRFRRIFCCSSYLQTSSFEDRALSFLMCYFLSLLGLWTTCTISQSVK